MLVMKYGGYEFQDKKMKNNEFRKGCVWGVSDS